MSLNRSCGIFKIVLKAHVFESYIIQFRPKEVAHYERNVATISIDGYFKEIWTHKYSSPSNNFRLHWIFLDLMWIDKLLKFDKIYLQL